VTSREILEIVVFHALHGCTPNGSGGLTGASYGANLVNTGINTVRGSAADCLASLLFSQSPRWQTLQTAVLSVVRDDRGPSGRSAISCLTALLISIATKRSRCLWKPQRRMTPCLARCFVPRFLQFASQTHYEALRGIRQECSLPRTGDAREAAAQTYRWSRVFGRLRLHSKTFSLFGARLRTLVPPGRGGCGKPPFQRSETGWANGSRRL